MKTYRWAQIDLYISNFWRQWSTILNAWLKSLYAFICLLNFVCMCRFVGRMHIYKPGQDPSVRWDRCTCSTLVSWRHALLYLGPFSFFFLIIIPLTHNVKQTLHQSNAALLQNTCRLSLEQWAMCCKSPHTLSFTSSAHAKQTHLTVSTHLLHCCKS